MKMKGTKFDPHIHKKNKSFSLLLKVLVVNDVGCNTICKVEKR